MAKKRRLNTWGRDNIKSYKAKLQRDKLAKISGKVEYKPVKYYCHGAGNN